ncbi:MAG: T9SS type A sorting domain-containing protein [Cytophagaceae bacterium]|nr:T9SS type A sorting domain-containing protein [Cytophagaceae bacterium]
MTTRIFLNLFSILCFFSVHFCHSQNFQRLIGTSSNDSFSSMILLSNGEYIVTGTTVRAGAGTDLYVARIDASGSIVWENTYGGTGNENNSVSCINNNGNIVIAASSSSYNGNRDLDLFIFEISPNGTVMWSRSYGAGTNTSNLDEIPRKLNLSPTGLVLCATIGTPGSLSMDVLAYEVSNDGRRMNWQNQISISGNFGDIPSSIIPGQLGTYIMVGGSYTVMNNYDQVIWRLNSNGSLQSNIAYGGPNNENAQDVVLLPNNDIVVMGNFRVLSGSGLEFSLVSIGSNNAFKWIKTYGDNDIRDERAYGFTQTTNGYAFCGYTNGRTGNDILLIWTDNDGNLIGNTSIGDNGKEESSALVQNLNGSFTIAGVSNSRSTGLDDGFLITTNSEGRVDNNCSSYNIIERNITRNIRSYVYSQSNPQLSNRLINLTVDVSALSVVDLRCLTLPLELIDFQILSKHNRNVLTWISLNEYNLSHFEIEKSLDAKNWKLIDIIESEGGLDEKKIYTYDDYEKESNCSYYRLKQVDKDNSYSYSKILKSYSVLPEPFIYPNPTERFLSIKGIVLRKQEVASILIKNLQGIIVLEGDFKFDYKTEGELNIDLENLDLGMYVMSFTYQDKVHFIKIIKE